MARKGTIETVRVVIDDYEPLDGCVINVRTGVKFGTLVDMDRNRPETVIPMLLECLESWEGFGDLPCNEQGIRQLHLHEVMAITQKCVTVIANPRRTSNGTG